MHIKIHLYAPMHMNTYATRILTRNAHLNSRIIHTSLQNIISGDSRYWKKKCRIEQNAQNDRVLEIAMALPFLPAIRMEDGLTILGREILAVAAPGMRDFYTYWRRTWLPLKEVISVFRKKIRTNNIAENCNRHLLLKLGERERLWRMLDNVNNDIDNFKYFGNIYIGDSAHNWKTMDTSLSYVLFLWLLDYIILSLKLNNRTS